jgi:hypothetical protein
MLNILKSAWEEVWGLFVDDPIFAGAIVVWILVTKLTIHALPSPAAAPILFGGLVIILVALTYRQAVGINRKR